MLPSQNNTARTVDSTRNMTSDSGSFNSILKPRNDITSSHLKPAKLPPPIPIPNLLLDRSRLKPIPKPFPAPLQTPSTFNHLIPLRSKLRSTTSPAVAPPLSEPSSIPLPITSRSISLGSTSTRISDPSTHDVDLPSASNTNTTPIAPTSLAPNPSIDLDSDLVPTTSDTPVSISTAQSNSMSSHPIDTILASADLINNSPTEAESFNHSPVTPTALNPSAHSLSSKSSSPEKSPSSPTTSHSASVKSLPPVIMPDPSHESAVPCPQDAHSSVDSHQDQIQPWQNHFNHASSVVDHSSLERAHSAAARLDSLARLNGVTMPQFSRRSPNTEVLPPFLMAKHIEETSKAVHSDQVTVDLNQISHLSPPTSYPLPLPVSLGFSVGLNGRGVPRLSALQRKALEKIANQQGSTDLATATTSLTRSHTTTGTESPKHSAHRNQPSANDESQERQQARCNLIRKLSSRGTHSRPKLQTQLPPPTQPPSALQEIVDNYPLGHTSPSSTPLEQPHSGLSPQDQSIEPTPPSHSLPSPTSAQAQSDPDLARISQLDTIAQCLDASLQPESGPMTQSKQTSLSHDLVEEQVDTISKTERTSDQCTPSAHRFSFNLSDSHTQPDQPVHAPNPFDTSLPATFATPIPTPPSFISSASQLVYNSSLPATTQDDSSILSHPESLPRENRFEAAPTFSLCDPQSSPSGRLTNIFEPDVDHKLTTSPPLINPTDSNEFVAQLLSPAPSPSVRSSIASRLKARTSLSSRIDRSLASGRPTSPKLYNSPQSFVSNTSESKTDRRCSATSVNPRASRPSYLSTFQRFRTTHETSADQATTSNGVINPGGVTSPIKPFHHADRPLRPIRAPPIAEAHSVVGRGLAQHKSFVDKGPSQFPPTPHLVRTHMPVASADDLARYNDHKLAPFPGLLNTTPPSSPDRPRSPRSHPKNHKFSNHGILSSASHFFRSPGGRNRGESLTSEPRANVPPPKHSEVRLSPKFSVQMTYPNEAETEIVDSSRWQSMGDVAEKMSSAVTTTLSSGDESMSMVSSQRREQILARLSPFLKSPAYSTSPNFRVDDPPRQLLWHQPVLQVANSASFKDRYLFLFNDILVITKPILEFEDSHGERVPKLPITLDHSFLTKSVVELKDLRFMSTGPPEPLWTQGADVRFKEEFQRDPSQAVQSYLSGVNIQNKAYEIAKLLLSTRDIDKRQLGQYLSGPEHADILMNYLEQLNFSFMRLEDALRVALLSLRLPADPGAITRFLEQFGTAWTKCNPKVCLSAALATRWATAMIALSENLHDELTDSMRYVAGLIAPPIKLQTEAQFFDMIKVDFDSEEGKSSTALPVDKLDAMLKKAYQSIRRDRLFQGRSSIEDTQQLQLLIEEGNSKGLPLPNQLTYQVASDLITISIPNPDPMFGIKLFGPGLSFEPSFLSFSHSHKASFRIKGKAIGMRQISFVKIGRRAAAYEGLPLNAMVSVERAFMQHTVQVGFYNHLSVKRKYLFSFHGSQPKMKFTELITQSQSQARTNSPQIQSQDGPQAMSKMVAMQVLRDTLILNEDLVPMNVNPYASTTVVLTAGNRKTKAPRGQNDDTVGRKASKIRSNSISETYIHTIGQNERELHQAILDKRNQAQEMHVRNKQKNLLKEQLKSNLEGGKMGLNPYSCSNKDSPVGVADEHQNQFLIAKYAKTGFHLTQHCEQNSLIPLVLGFLSTGVGGNVKAKPVNSHNSLKSFPSLGNFRSNQKLGGHRDEDKTQNKQSSSFDDLLVSQHPVPPYTGSSVFNFSKFVTK